MATQISKHRDGWKKFIGGKRFYSPVGMARETFVLIAGSLERQWQVIVAEGRKVWTEEDIDAAYARVKISRIVKRESKSSNDSQVRRAGGRLSLYASIDKYLIQLKAQAPQQISIGHYEKSEMWVRRLCKLMTDRPVDEIEYDDLIELKNKIISLKRPSGQPFAPDSIITVMNCVKAFFGYLECATNWLPPRGFDRAMKIDRPRLISQIRGDDDDEEDESELEDAKTFKPAELAGLWRGTTDIEKIILGLGLFAGFTAVDIASLRKKMIVIDGDEVYIARKRQKTRHRQKYKTKWWLPPEIALLVRTYLERTSDNPAVNPDGLLILTVNRRPLIHRAHRGMGRKTDHVRAVWESRIRSAAKNGECRRLSHKHLRKTGGRFIRYGIGEDWKGAGLEVAQQFLAHSAKTVAEKHYLGKPDFSALHAAQRALYEQLKPIMFPSSMSSGEAAEKKSSAA